MWKSASNNNSKDLTKPEFWLSSSSPTCSRRGSAYVAPPRNSPLFKSLNYSFQGSNTEKSDLEKGKFTFFVLGVTLKCKVAKIHLNNSFLSMRYVILQSILSALLTTFLISGNHPFMMSQWALCKLVTALFYFFYLSC